ncbi:MAG: hypothetical protein EP315_06505 [Gammaproteobacteria bacterium]|nr:MAG: hypothetical protein EP315_06505 [Gammaproteobacteria bacterium]
MLLCIALMLNVSVALAAIYPIITYTCDPDEDVLKVKNEVKYDDEGRNFVYSEKDGTYNPWDWVRIEDRGERRLVSESKRIELSCQLSNNLYKVLLQPKIFNANYLGGCGDRISVIVTIFRGGSIVLERKEFESYCHGNAPVVRGVKVFGKSGELKIVEIPKHEFY